MFDTITDAVLETELHAHKTLSMNGAGLTFPAAANISSTFVTAFGTAANTNIYLTKSGAQVSIPPHNDDQVVLLFMNWHPLNLSLLAQDVFILQMMGFKRWNLYRPLIPLPGEKQGVGKYGDVVSRGDLGDATHELLLGPGSVLYVPRGYVHGTSTLGLSPDGGNYSMHMTVGIETAVLKNTFESGLKCAARLQASIDAAESSGGVTGYSRSSP